MAQENKFDFIIGGYLRSGTTLLRMLIDSHPECFVGPESKVFYPPKERQKICIDWYNKFLNTNFTKKSIGEEKIVKKLKEKYPNLKFFGEKSPRNFRYYTHFLNETNKKIIHIYRNSEKVYKSLNKKRNKKMNYKNFKKRWDKANECLNWEESDRFIIINYEDLCKNLYNNLDKVFNFIGASTDVNYDSIRESYDYSTVNKKEWENNVNINSIKLK